MQAASTSPARVRLADVLIVLLAAATAVIHLTLNFPDIMFILNGLGYLAMTAALFLPAFRCYRRWVRLLLIGFTLVTILGWVAFGERSVIGYVDKAVEVALLVLLVFAPPRE